jgi:hypothetical protein
MHVSVAAKIKDQVEKQQFADAEQSWSELESVILQSSNSVVSKAVHTCCSSQVINFKLNYLGWIYNFFRTKDMLICLQSDK